MKNRLVVGVLSMTFAACHAAGAEQHDEFERGQSLYKINCAVCHHPTGGGIPPTFPTLRGNSHLADIDLIVDNVHRGQGAMPAFPHLTADEIVALATYVRNAWGNDFGDVTAEEVASVLAGYDAVDAPVSVWEGVYTEDQAQRGKSVFRRCVSCHGTRGDGIGVDPIQPSAPLIAGGGFLYEWDGRSLATLHQFTRTTMPQNNPRSLSDQQYVDAIAYMLSLSEVPAGDDELIPDPESLVGIMIGTKPEQN